MKPIRRKTMGGIMVISVVAAFLVFGFTVPVVHVQEEHSCGLPPSTCGCSWDDSIFLWLFGVGLRSTYKYCYVP